MYRRLYLLLIAAIVAAALADRARAQTVVRVLQYNIERTVGSPSSNVAGQPALAKIVKYLAPDIWTINELGGFEQDYNSATLRTKLAEFIDNYDVFGTTAVFGQDYFIYVGMRTDGYIAQAIVSRHPFLSTQTYSDGGAGYSPLRGLVGAYVNLPGAVELGVFTAHLKALSGNTDAARRQSEATADAATLSSWLSAHPGDGALMTGDINASEEPGDNDNWSGGAVGNPITMMDGSTQIYQPITTFKNVGLADAAPASIAGNKDTIDSTSPDTRFDYIFHRAAHLTYLSGYVFDTKQHSAAQLSALNAANGTNFVAADCSTASDHLPVLEVFLATPGPSYVAAQSTSSIASTTAVLNGTINPNGFGTIVRVELGATTAYGAVAVAQTLPAGTAGVNLSFNAAGFAPGTTYHFRFTTENEAGTSVGPDRTFTTAAFLDSDGDTLPNDWETANGLNPNLASDAALDSDGDGASNQAEYSAATNPRANASVLRLAIARSGSAVALSWPSVFGKRYQLQSRISLTTGAWGAVGNNLGGTGATLSVTEGGATPSDPRRFYRLITLP